MGEVRQMRERVILTSCLAAMRASVLEECAIVGRTGRVNKGGVGGIRR
jgi:hypothetical protein